MKSQTAIRNILERKYETSSEDKKHEIEAKFDLLSRYVNLKREKTQEHIRSLAEIDALIFKLIEE